MKKEYNCKNYEKFESSLNEFPRDCIFYGSSCSTCNYEKNKSNEKENSKLNKKLTEIYLG